MSFLTEVCQEHHHIVVAEVVRCLALSDSTLTSLPQVPAQRGWCRWLGSD